MRGVRRWVSVSFKPDVIKVAVQSPETGLPKLFVVRRGTSLSEFTSILRNEFLSVGSLELHVHDGSGIRAPLPPDAQIQISFFDQMKDKELAIVADGAELGMRYDTSSSELKKRFILDLAEKTIAERLVEQHNAVLKTELSTYLQTNFKSDLKKAFDDVRPEIENRKASIDAIISFWETFSDRYIDQSIRKSMKPVKLLLALSTLQFATLFYLTFFVYDWNVVEPLAYMLSLSVQLGFLAGYAFKRKLIGPELLYTGNLKGMMSQLHRNAFYAEELYIKRRALDNLKILFR